MSWHNIILKDKDGCTLVENEAPNLKEAKEKAKYYLSDEWATRTESTHAILGTEKVEVTKQSNGEVVWDKYYDAAR